MAIYYTDSEGAMITLLPVKRMHQKITKQLFKNRSTNKHLSYLYGYRPRFRSTITVNGKYINVFSVFFTKGNKITKVWDARLNGYRPREYIKRLVTPPIIRKL